MKPQEEEEMVGLGQGEPALWGEARPKILPTCEQHKIASLAPSSPPALLFFFLLLLHYLAWPLPQCTHSMGLV